MNVWPFDIHCWLGGSWIGSTWVKNIGLGWVDELDWFENRWTRSNQVWKFHTWPEPFQSVWVVNVIRILRFNAIRLAIYSCHKINFKWFWILWYMNELVQFRIIDIWYKSHNSTIHSFFFFISWKKLRSHICVNS